MIARFTQRLNTALLALSCAMFCLAPGIAAATATTQTTSAVSTNKTKATTSKASTTKASATKTNSAKSTTRKTAGKTSVAKTTAKSGQSATKASSKNGVKSGKQSSKKSSSKRGRGKAARFAPSTPGVAVKPIFNAAPITGPKFTAARASLKVVVNGEDIPYQRFFTTVLPGQPLNISVQGQEQYVVSVDGKPLSGQDHRWVWQAPAKPGYHQVQVVEQLTQKTLNLHVFVLSTLKNGSDNIAGFTIGRYPPPKDGKAQYNAPLGFIEVNAANQHLYLSPHFQLGQFLCRQKHGLPQYIALMPDLLEKLEWLLEAVNQRGTRLDTFEVMSGFRTPFYNRLIRNVVHSRHIYGSAADIFIDVNPRDGIMDDLNRDGRFDKKDAEVLYNLADAISEAHPHLAGGVGQYSGNGAHGPFVHVDVRGFDARWGNK